MAARLSVAVHGDGTAKKTSVSNYEQFLNPMGFAPLLRILKKRATIEPMCCRACGTKVRLLQSLCNHLT